LLLVKAIATPTETKQRATKGGLALSFEVAAHSLRAITP